MPSAPSPRRVVSLIASATEIICGLGRRDWLVGRSHECDFPATVEELPALTAPKFPLDGSSADIDRRVRELVQRGLAVYRVEDELLKELAPDVIVTQDQCDVCAASLADVEAATCTWTGRAVDIVSLKPDALADVWTDIRRVAAALRAEAAGTALVAEVQRRIAAVTAEVAGRPRPRVAFIEWADPLMAGGNWMPELVAAAGGRNMLGAAGKPSGVMQWDEVVAADPEVVVIAPCGYGLERTKAELPVLTARPGWEALAAVRDGRVYCADGNAFFNRPGPRLAETVEMLAEMLHPAATGRRHEGAAFVRML